MVANIDNFLGFLDKIDKRETRKILFANKIIDKKGVAIIPDNSFLWIGFENRDNYWAFYGCKKMMETHLTK